MWNYGGSKILKIIRAIDNGFNKVLASYRGNILDVLVTIYNELKAVTSIPACRFGSALFPLEQVKEYKPSIFSPNTAPLKPDILAFLRDHKFAVGALDSSTYNPGPHIAVNIGVVNVGYWYMNYSLNNGGSDNYAELISNISSGVDEELTVKDVEFKVVKILVEKLEDSKKFLLLDESLSLTYTLSWTSEAREQMALKIKGVIDESLKHNVIPVGVYYTRAADILRGIVAITDRELKDIPLIPDRALLNHVLSVNSRSPIFLVHSKALQNIGLKILCFYVKLGERNIVRVEFPMEAKETVNDIYSLILAQSMLGNGYPLAMQRAHEMAVLRINERRIIEEEICRKLGMPAVEYLLSRKAVSKRWPVA